MNGPTGWAVSHATHKERGRWREGKIERETPLAVAVAVAVGVRL